MMFHFRTRQSNENHEKYCKVVTCRSDNLTLEPMPLALISILGDCVSMAKLLITTINWNDYFNLLWLYPYQRQTAPVERLTASWMIQHWLMLKPDTAKTTMQKETIKKWIKIHGKKNTVQFRLNCSHNSTHANSFQDENNRKCKLFFERCRQKEQLKNVTERIQPEIWT